MPNLALLVVGLLPLGYVIWLGLRFGFAEALSLRPAGVAFLWVGYHLSPWLYFLTGETWGDFLLVPEHINSGLLFSTLCSSCFLVGYYFVFNNRLARFRAYSASHQKIIVRTPIVVALSLLVLLSSIASAGGINEFWSATSPRGEAQFFERDAVGMAIQMISVLRLPLTIGLSIVAALIIIQGRRSYDRIALGIAGLLVASIHGMYFFSRAAGFSLIMFAFVALRIRGKRAIGYSGVAILIALFMGSVGLNYRGDYYPGVGNYLSAAADSISLEIEGKGDRQTSSKFQNALDSQAPFTRFIDTGAGENRDSFSLALKLLWNLNPLPSELVPQYEIGERLAIVMGTWGNTAINTPALAELYLVFGYAGSVGMLLIGLICGWFEKRSVLQPSPLNLLNVILLFASFPIGLHNSLRAMTRPYVYGCALVIAARTRHVRRRLVSQGRQR